MAAPTIIYIIRQGWREWESLLKTHSRNSDFEDYFCKEGSVLPCSLIHFSQQPGYGNNLSVLSLDEQIKMSNICAMEYYSAMRKKKILPFATTRMDLGSLMLRERQTLPVKSRKKKKVEFIETEQPGAGCQGKQGKVDITVELFSYKMDKV